MDSLAAPLDLTTGIPQSSAPPDMAQAFGENPWDVQQRQQDKDQLDWFQKSQATLDKAALEPETFFKDKDLSFARTPQDAYRIATTDAFLTLHSNGAPLPPDDLSRKLLRAQLADQLFEGRGRENDEAFHAEIVADATRRKSTREITSKLITEAATSDLIESTDFFEGGSRKATFATWKESAARAPGYDPAREADYYEAWTQTRRAATEARREFQAPLNSIWRAFQSKGDVTTAARNAYFETPTEARPRFMAALRLLAGTLPAEEQPAFFANLSKQSGRDIKGFGQSALDGLRMFSDYTTVAGNPEQTPFIANAKVDREMIDFSADVQRIQQADYDPMKYLAPDESWRQIAEKGLYAAPGAAVTSAAAAIPGVGMSAFYFSSQESIYQELRQKLQDQGMPYEQAAQQATTLSTVAALPQVLMERLQIETFAGKLPLFEKALTSLSDKIANRAARFGARAVVGAAEEAVLEKSQDLVPSAVQDIAHALDSDIPDVQWSGTGGVLDGYWADNAEMFVTMLPLAMFGAAGGISADARVKAFAQATDNEILAAGVSPDDLAKIREGATKGLASGIAAIESAFTRLDPRSDSAKAAVEALAQDSALQQEAMRSGVLPTLQRSASGWSVLDGETGELVGTAPTSSEAFRLAKTHSATMDDLDADRVAYMASMMESADAVSKLDQGSNETVTRLSLMTGMTETIAAAEDPAQATRYAEQVALKERMAGGTGEMAYSILGKSSTEIAGNLRRTINDLYRGSTVTDVFHEAFHGFRREAHAAGRLTRADDIAILRALDTILAGKATKMDANGRTEKLRFLPEGITDDQITATMLDEAISHVGEMEILRSRTGSSSKTKLAPSGIVTRNLTAIGRIVGQKTANTFKAFMDAIRAHFGLSLSRALALKKAEREGKFDASTLDSYLAKLLGTTEQDQHNQEVAKQTAELLGTDYSGENVDAIGAGDPFSIGRTTIFPTPATRSFDTTDGKTLIGPAAFSIAPDYGISHRPSEDGPRAFDLAENDLMPADVYDHPEWYSGMDAKIIRETMAQLRKVRGNPDGILTIFRAGPAPEMNPGDWVSLSKEYARTHADSQDPEKFKVWQSQAKASDVRWAMDDLAEFGYFGEKTPATDTGVSFSIKAFHGTPHKVDRFSLDKIGTGEGQQAYGWGLYFAKQEDVANTYRSSNRQDIPDGPLNGLATLLRHRTEDQARPLFQSAFPDQSFEATLKDLKPWLGNLYTVTLDVNNEDLLDWDKPLSEQPEKIRQAITPFLSEKFISDSGYSVEKLQQASGAWLYFRFGLRPWGISDSAAKSASYELWKIGIPGIRYLDRNSRDSGTGSYNYVIFDESKIQITEENGKPVDLETAFSISPQQDADYLAAVKAGDMETAQAMVDEAAKAAGYTIGPVFHNSPASNIESFLPFARDILNGDKSLEDVKTLLKQWRERKAAGIQPGYMNFRAGTFFATSQIDYKEYGNHQYSAYLRADNPLTKAGNKVTAPNPSQPIDALFLDMNDDGIVEEMAIFDPSQIKSAAAITRDQAGNVIPLSRRFNPADDRFAYSLAPSERNAALMGDALARVKDPIRRAQAMAKISKNFNELRLAAERVELLAGSKRLRKSLQKEAAMREAQRADELERDAYARHYGILSTNDLTTLKSRPLHELLAVTKRDGTVDHLHGRLMSKAAAMKQHPDLFRETSYGGYDAVDGVSPTVFGGKLLPSEAAQEAYSANLISEPTPDALWEKLKQEQASVATMKEAMAKAEADIKAARTIAREETNAWLASQTETQATAYSPKQEILRALAGLDAILTAIPADVRGRIGGYTALASLGSEETRLAFLKEKLAKADTELEGWMRRQYDAEFRKLLDQARPLKKEAGEKPRGKVGADIHDLFRAVEDSMTFTAQEVEAEVERLDNLANHVDTTPEQQAHLLQQAGLIALAGNWGKADAARREAALLEATRIYSNGYAAFQRQLSAKREDRAKSRDSLRADTGKAGERMERLTREIKDSGTKIGRAKQTLLSLYSFEQVLQKTFGQDSPVGKMLADWERRAASAKHDAIHAKMDALDELFADLAQGKFKGEQLRWDLAQPGAITVKDFKGRTQTFSQLEAISATLMWMQEDGKRHMEGHFSEETNTPNGDWHWRQQDIDAIEAQLSSTAKAVRLHLMEEYAQEYDRLNAVFQSLYGVNLPRHKFYSPITVAPVAAAAGQMMDPVTGSTMTGASLTPGSLRTRSQTAVAEPRFTDALQTFIAHTKQMEHWMAYTPFATEAMNLLNNREVGNSIEAAAGKEAKNILRAWIDYFAQGGVRDAAAHLAINGWFSRALGRASQAALVGRVSVLAIQSLQLGAAAYEMPIASFVKRFAKLTTGQANWKAAYQSDYIQRRLKEMPPMVRQSLEGLASSKPSRLKFLVRQMGETINGADALFTAGTYAIIYDYQLAQATKSGLTGKAAEDYAHEAAERGTDRVAQPVRPGARSLYELTATSPAARLMWAFASEARQKFAITAYALAEKPTAEKLKAVAITWGVGGALAAVIRAALRDMRDDGDDEFFDERNWDPRKLALQTLTGPLQGIPILGKEIESSINAAFDQWQTDGSLLSAGRQLAQRYDRMDDHLAKGDVDNLMKDAELILTFLSPGSDSMAASTSISHLVRDLYNLLKNAAN